MVAVYPVMTLLLSSGVFQTTLAPVSARVVVTFPGASGTSVTRPSVITHSSAPVRTSWAALAAPAVYFDEPAPKTTFFLTFCAAQPMSKAS